MELEEACRLISDVAVIDVTPLPTRDAMEAFCERHRFHALQEYLSAEAFESIAILDDNVLCTNDMFQLRLILFQSPECLVAFGPYCTEHITEADAKLLLRKAGVPDVPVLDFRAWRGRYPVMPQNESLHLVRCLARAMGWSTGENRVRSVDFGEEAAAGYRESVPRRPYAQLVEDRYALEQQFMDHVSEGNTAAAIMDWKGLHRAVSGIKRVGTTLEYARISAAINRTTIRIAAWRAGMPAIVNDQISGASAQRIRDARTIDEIDREHERIIREYCQAIREQRNHGYDNLVMSTIYLIDHEYGEHITISHMAEELEVSTNHLIESFREQVGTTPNAYLNKVRLEHAARRLARSNAPVQQICTDVGIPDANYFARLFRREYGQTPTEYRRTHHL